MGLMRCIYILGSFMGRNIYFVANFPHFVGKKGLTTSTKEFFGKKLKVSKLIKKLKSVVFLS
jgi:hypothetical protein